jgi:hypothetical protein
MTQTTKSNNMANRTGNYTAFYVKEPFSASNLGAFATKDFVTYGQLRTWKGKNPSFPFVDSHEKNYNVRDGSHWETTLKPRLRDRLNKSKNIILILSSITVSSKALQEEIDWGINQKGLPVIVIYPEFKEKSDIWDCDNDDIKNKVKKLWDKLPIFKSSMDQVPTIHIPNNKTIIEKALNDPDFNVATKCDPGLFYYPC